MMMMMMMTSRESVLQDDDDDDEIMRETTRKALLTRHSPSQVCKAEMSRTRRFVVELMHMRELVTVNENPRIVVAYVL
jgi:hypothetical protein